MDAAMFQAQIKRVEKLLYRIAWSYLHNAEDVEDTVQDALIKAWEKRDTLRDMQQFTPWISRVVSNQCKDVLRKRKRWSFYPLAEDTVVLEMPEVEVPVLEAMKRLKPEYRLLMTLYYVDGYSVQELSESLGLAKGTVKSRMRSARKQLSITLQVEWEEDL